MAADVEHLWPPFRSAVLAMLADPEAKQLGLYVVSGFRSVELQAALYADALKRYGSVHEARKWVAPPGKSNHGPRLDVQGHEPGPYGRAVDLGMPGVPAVLGKWPKATKERVAALAKVYEIHSPLQWEDWHHEPMASMYTHPHPAEPEPVPVSKEEAMAMVVLDPKTPADRFGRLANWESDDQGNLYNWNGARYLKPLSAFAKTHPPIVAMAVADGGDGVVLFGNDAHQEPDGAWVRSTYKIVVGM